MLFFSIGALSASIAERILKFMVSIERKSLVYTSSGFKQPPSRATGKAIQYWKVIIRTIFKLNTHSWCWIVIAGSLIFMWRIPQFFDYTSTHYSIHVMQHLSFIMVGAAIIRLYGESFNLFLIFPLSE